MERSGMRGCIAVLGLSALAAQGAATAEVLIGGGAGVSQLSRYSDVDDGFGWRGFVGYRASDLPLYLEAQYFSSGEMDVDDTDGVQDTSIEFEGFAASVGYRVLLDDYGSDLVLKGGAYREDTTIKSALGKVKDDGSGALLGAGGNWMFTPNLGLNFDVQFFFEVEDFGNQENLTLATLGLVYAFHTD